MATYVMADIHGDSGRFDRMLEQTGLGAEDTLYILGDVIDRGSDGIALLRRIREMPNAVLLLGNHEWMMLRCMQEGATVLEVSSWMRNGGGCTMQDFLALPEAERSSLLDWLRKIPRELTVTVEDRTFRLVHGWTGEDEFQKVWGRPEELTQTSPLVGAQERLIIGHTPVLLLRCRTEREQDAHVRDLMARGDHLRILHTPGYINVDCGCAFALPVSRLGCLRLEDMREFYE